MKRLFILASLFLVSLPALSESNDQFNARFSPLGLIIGGLYANFDVKIAPQWTVGPDLGYFRFSMKSDANYFLTDYKVTAYSLGARANWFVNGAFNTGLYVGPTLRYMNVKVTTTDGGGDVSGETGGAFIACVVGYSWFWDSFNMMLGGGGTFGLGTNDIKVKRSNGTETSVTSNNIAGVVVEFSLGWTF